MKTENNFIFGVVAVGVLISAVVLSMNLASATAGIILYSPTSSSTMTGNIHLWVNVSEAITNNSNFSCKIYAKSVNTENSTYVFIKESFNVTASTGTANKTNTTFSSASVIDGYSYLFNVTCRNDSNWLGEEVVTGILVDNTQPTAPSSLIPTSKYRNTNGSVVFNATITNTNTKACTLFFPTRNPGEQYYNMTDEGPSCSHSLSNMLDESYEWYVRASDGKDTTLSSTNLLTIDRQGTASGRTVGVAYATGQAQEVTVGGQETLTIFGEQDSYSPVIIIIGIVIVIGLIFIYKKYN